VAGAYEVGVVGQFEAAHRLVGDFGPATRTHGHTYRVEVSVRGPNLRNDGTLLDIVPMQQGLDRVLADLHYQNLSELEPLAGRNTTAETVARFIHDQIAPLVAGQSISSLRVSVWESPLAYAAYESSPD
jgi:6-pyruvoyltetrahydropterin/6-carboxytetrahydropterin synthase